MISIVTTDLNLFFQKFRPIWFVLIGFLKFSKFLKTSKYQKKYEKIQKSIDINWSQLTLIDLNLPQQASFFYIFLFKKKRNLSREDYFYSGIPVGMMYRN